MGPSAWPTMCGLRHRNGPRSTASAPLAILIVMAAHFRLDAPGGIVGVDVFFVISGFLITSLLVGEHDRLGGIGLRNFWARRALRLFPALGCALVLVLVLSLAATPDIRHETIVGLPSVLLYGGNWARAFGSTNTLGLLGHTWSLAVEEQFYLVWPFVCLLLICRTRRRLRAAAVVAVLAILDCAYLLFAMAHWGQQQGFFRTDTHSMGLLAGAALALVIGNRSPALRLSERRAWMLRRVALMATVIIVFLALLQPKTPPEQGIMIITATGATVVLVARLVLDGAGRLSRLFGSGPARWIGRRSYGIYLYHFPISVVFLQRSGLHGLGYAAMVVAGLIGSIALAALSYRFVEAPFLRRKARFTTHAPVSSLQNA